MKKIHLLIYITLLFSEDRLISIGGCVTETIFELDLGYKVVAVDQSSTFPEEIKKLPQVGYIRSISSEGILSMYPDHILTTTDIGPPNVIQQIEMSGVKIDIFDSPHSVEDIIKLVENISVSIKASNKGMNLVDTIKFYDNKIKDERSSLKHKPKIAFFMNPSSGSYNASGNQTRANYLIEYIGGVNVFSDKFDKYKKVSKEEIIYSNPDIILVASIFESNKGDALLTFIDNDEFKSVNAVQNLKVFNVSLGKYLTFGPNFVKDALFLMKSLNIK